jgi:DNA-binding NarL/FixJ family response regulator
MANVVDKSIPLQDPASGAAMIRVCVVDDHEVVRRGIRQILSDTKDIQVSFELATGEELLSAAQNKRWDVTVLDLSMPGRGGIETLSQLKAQFPKLPVLVLTMHSEEQYAVRVLRAGADGFMTKEVVSTQLAGAVRKLARGEKYVTPDLAERLAGEIGRRCSELPHELLANREYQVFALLAEGFSVTEIAEKLSLSAKTISTNRARILTKMGLRNNAGIIVYAIKHRLVAVPSEP